MHWEYLSSMLIMLNRLTVFNTILLNFCYFQFVELLSRTSYNLLACTDFVLVCSDVHFSQGTIPFAVRVFDLPEGGVAGGFAGFGRTEGTGASPQVTARDQLSPHA